MSDREFAGFDMEVVADAVRQPPLDELRPAARRRRPTTRLVAVAALVGLAGLAAVPLAVTGSGEVTRPGLTESPPPAPGVSQLFFLDQQTAVGVQEAEGCSVSFAYTDDLGRNWSNFQTFPHNDACRTDAEGHTLSDFRYHPLGARTYLVAIDEGSYLSTDAGRNWQDAESAVTAVESFPAEADPVVCQSSCVGVPEAMAVNPTTGEVFRLSGEPPSKFPLHSMYESIDGTLWATYWPGDAMPVVARSSDRGATWQVSTGPQWTVSVVGQSRDVAYLLAEPHQNDEGTRPDGPSRLLRTVDGGRTWDELATDLPDSDRMGLFTVGSDNSLLVADANPTQAFVWVSRDGGRHFTKGPALPVNNFLGAAPGRVWASGEQAHVTTDGINWTQLPLP